MLFVKAESTTKEMYSIQTHKAKAIWRKREKYPSNLGETTLNKRMTECFPEFQCNQRCHKASSEFI